LIIGVPVGFGAGAFVFRAFVDRIGAVPDPALPFVLIAGVVVGIVALANLVAIVPTRRARRFSTAERLQAE
jgi:ABC-type antimicrobial peptide transport system permease subunit